MKLTREQLDAIKAKKYERSFVLNKAAIDETARTVELAFSSEDPYMRWFGLEILGHEKGECDLSFLESGAAPLLNQHNHDKQTGVIEKAWIDKDRKGRAVVRFGKSAAAEELFQDVIDGIKKNVSVGYQVNEMKLIESNDETGDTYRMIWAPFEVSIVSVPADKTVGVGRSAEEQLINHNKGSKTMTEEEKAAKAAAEAQVRANIQQQFNNDTRDILAMAKDHGFIDQGYEFISAGKSPDEFKNFVLGELKKRGMKPVNTPDAAIGLNERELKEFSFLRIINALANPTNARAQEAAAFEFEASRAVADKLRKSPNGIYVPLDILKRELTVGVPGAGGNLVGTNLMTGSFIDMMRARMILERMGATTLTGLIGDVAIPRQSGGATAYWIAESGDSTPSDQSFDQVPLTPKTVAARTPISRKLLLQSSLDIENFVRNDLARTLGIGVDLAGIMGDGTGNQPTGIAYTNGVGAVIGGANGAAPTWQHCVDLWAEVSQDNADVGSLGYLTNSKVIGKLMQTEKAAGTAQFVVKDFPDRDGFTSIGGARTGVTNQIPSTLTKGTAAAICSALMYGNFSDVIIGMWGTLDIVVDAVSSNDGSVTVKTYQDVDVAVRHPESFAVMTDVLTN